MLRLPASLLGAAVSIYACQGGGGATSDGGTPNGGSGPVCVDDLHQDVRALCSDTGCFGIWRAERPGAAPWMPAPYGGEYIRSGAGWALCKDTATSELEIDGEITAVRRCGCTDVDPSLIGSTGGGAGGGGSSSRQVHLRFAAFIPCGAVNVPGPREYPYVVGDNRSFDYDRAATASRTVVSLLLDSNGIVAETAHVGATHAYYDHQIEHDDGICYRVEAGEQPALERTDPNPRSDGWVNADRSGRDYNWVQHVGIRLHATNPISYAAPSLDGEITVHIEYDGNFVPRYFWVDGAHDAFPAYELYVNGHRVHQHDPIAAGKSPFDLFPPDDDVRVDLGRRSIPARR